MVKASRTATHLNQKEGMVPEKGAQTPQVKVAKPKAPQDGMSKAQGIIHRLPSWIPIPSTNGMESKM